MLIGFVGYNDPPPGRTPLPDDPDDPGDDAENKRAQSLRKSKSRFARGAPRTGKYAWLISIAIHGAVILGAVLAARYYYHRSASRPVAVQNSGREFDGLVMGGDSTDAVHYLPFGPALASGAGTSIHDLWGDRSDLPSLWFEPQTLASLQPDVGAVGQRTLPTDPGNGSDEPVFKTARAGALTVNGSSAATQPGTSPPISRPIH
jgi:hypothetical protein